MVRLFLYGKCSELIKMCQKSSVENGLYVLQIGAAYSY